MLHTEDKPRRSSASAYFRALLKSLSGVEVGEEKRDTLRWLMKSDCDDGEGILFRHTG